MVAPMSRDKLNYQYCTKKKQDMQHKACLEYLWEYSYNMGGHRTQDYTANNLTWVLSPTYTVCLLDFKIAI